MGAIIKHLSVELPNEVILFFRNSLAFLIIVPLVLYKEGPTGFATRQFRFHALRGAIGVSAMSCFFYILGRMHFTEAILLKLCTPFFIPIVALLWLRENSSKTTLFAILLGFIGVVFIVDPQNKGWSEVDLVMIGLLGAALAAVAKVTIRRMKDSEPSLRIVFYFSVFASLFFGSLCLGRLGESDSIAICSASGIGYCGDDWTAARDGSISARVCRKDWPVYLYITGILVGHGLDDLAGAIDRFYSTRLPVHRRGGAD